MVFICWSTILGLSLKREVLIKGGSVCCRVRDVSKVDVFWCFGMAGLKTWLLLLDLKKARPNLAVLKA